ncbi:MAG: hypothetical protein HPY85_10235 [Anaerolineae bacterium]|nr:hypothetical protein [Anaerolineae bacterium]
MNENSSQPSWQNHMGYISPVLEFDPKQLDFGAYNPNHALLQQPTILLHIRNAGGSTLTGRLIPQVSWLIINKIQFNCAPGETSEHALQISTGAPQNWNETGHHVRHAVVISSNAGAAALDAAYTLNFHKQVYSPAQLKLTPRDPSRIHTRFLFPLAGVFFLIMIFLGLRNLFGAPTPREQAGIERDQLLTQGAQTMMAQAGGTETVSSAFSGALGMDQGTPTSQSLFAPLTTDTPDLTATAFQPTFTPWPAEAYPNPEVFVQEYFALLAERNYNTSWDMLSRRYQEECCTALGTDPYYIYARDWDEVETISLITAYLQEYDRNPAPVQVRYQLKKVDEQAQEFTAMVWLIADEARGTLLIDVIDNLAD